jgi:hypothetical protein
MNNDKENEHCAESELLFLQQDFFEGRASHTPPSQPQERTAISMPNLWQALFSQVRIAAMLINAPI